MPDPIPAAAASNRPLMPNGIPPPDDFDETLIRKVVYGFYDKVRKDDLLAPIFGARIADEEWTAHLVKMCDFWSSSFLRTSRYEGRPLPPHLTIPELSDGHFQRWLQLFAETTDEHCSPDAASGFYDLARRIAHSFRLALAFHRGEDTVGIHPFPER